MDPEEIRKSSQTSTRLLFAMPPGKKKARSFLWMSGAMNRRRSTMGSPTLALVVDCVASVSGISTQGGRFLLSGDYSCKVAMNDVRTSDARCMLVTAKYDY